MKLSHMTQWIAALDARRFVFSLCAATLVVLAVVGTSFAQAQQRSFTPTDESPEDLPVGDGREETFYACTACHGISNKIVGPGFNEVLAKHQGKTDLVPYLAEKIKAGGSGVYGAVPMPPQPQISDADAKAIAEWIASGAK